MTGRLKNFYDDYYTRIGVAVHYFSNHKITESISENFWSDSEFTEFRQILQFVNISGNDKRF